VLWTDSAKANLAELAERLKVSNDATKAEEVRPTKVYSPEELQKVINKTRREAVGLVGIVLTVIGLYLHSPTPEQLFAADLPMTQLILNHVSKICPWS
jgi:hypothetical protein